MLFSFVSFLFPPSSLVRDKSQFRVIVERQEINKGAMMMRRQQLYDISHEGSLSLVPRVWELLKAGLSFQSHHAIWGKEAVRKHLVPSFLAVLQSLLHGAACLMHASQMPFPILSQRSCKSKVEKVHCHGMIGGGRALLCREVVHVFHEPSFHPDGVCSMSLSTKSCNFSCYFLSK